jgi:SAM-dependent methyltransferase
MVIFALGELGFFESIRGKMYVDSLTMQELGIQPYAFTALCQTLQGLGILEEKGPELYQLTSSAEAIFQQRGYFTWAVGSYGDVLRNLADLATGQKRFGRDVDRDERFVAKGAGMLTAQNVHPVISNLLDAQPSRVLVDLGCGGGGLLIHLCQRYPHLRAVGIDLSARACEFARQNVAKARLEERIEIIEADISDPFHSSNERGVELLRQADTITGLLMLHDLMEEKARALDILCNIKNTYTHVKHYVFVDTMKASSLSSMEQSYFTLGFELVHAFMGQHLWTKEVYNELFTEAGFTVQNCLEVGIPSTWLYSLKPL